MTITVRGHRVRTQSQRRYLVVAVRSEPLVIERDSESARVFGREPGYYPAFARVEKRSDSPITALRETRRRSGYGVGVAMVVVDTGYDRGEEIK